MPRVDNRYELSSFEVKVLRLQRPEWRFDARYRLSPSEERIARHLVYGQTDKKIAEIFGISAKRVKKYVTVILGKLQVNSRHNVITKTQRCEKT